MCSLLGITGVSAWVALERWAFQQYRGAKWAAVVLRETKSWIFAVIRGLSWSTMKNLTRQSILGAKRVAQSSQTLVQAAPEITRQQALRVGEALLTSARQALVIFDSAPRPYDPERPSVPVEEETKSNTAVNVSSTPARVEFSKPVDNEYHPDAMDMWFDHTEDLINANQTQQSPGEEVASSLNDVIELIGSLKNLRECDVYADTWPPGIRDIRFSPNGDFLLAFG